MAVQIMMDERGKIIPTIGLFLYFKYLHTELWGWLEKHPARKKREWPGWTDWEVNDLPLFSSVSTFEDFLTWRCFACYWSDIVFDFYREDFGSEAMWDSSKCEFCPIKDPKNYGTCFNDFQIWSRAVNQDLDAKTRLALRTRMARSIKKRKWNPIWAIGC